MLNFETESDRIARANLETRRDREAARRQRIFNDKLRTIGVDKEALDMQVREKKKQEEDAKKEESACDSDMLHNSKAARILHRRQAKEVRALEESVVAFRRERQQPRHRREFDLNDPDRLRKTDRADAQMTLPGLVGEDPESEGRRQRQRQQLQAWLVQQQVEREAAKRQERLEEQLYHKGRVEMDDVALQLQMLEVEKRRVAAVANKDYNLSKIEEKRRQKWDENDKVDHLQQQLMGADAGSMVGVPGLCPSTDRRPPSESPMQLIHFQQQQMEEKRKAELEKKQEEAALDGLRLASARTALLLDRRQARLSKQLRRHLDNANAQLAETHKQQKPDIERGYIDSSFFSKFNTCSR